MRVTTSPTGDTVGFDGLRAVVGAGEGVVGRFPGIVCVARCPDPGPLRELLALCASVAGPDPGRALARRLATWMSGSAAPGPELRFGTVASAGEQLAVFLVGAVEARVEGLGGLTLSGAHAAIGTDRLFTRPRTPVMLSLEGGQVRTDPVDVYDLQAGVVPGAGVVLHPATFDRDEQDTDEDAALAGHEWFDTADLAADPLEQSSWSPGVPAQRSGERNGVSHRPGIAEDMGWSAPAPEPFDAGDDDPLNENHEGRHALLGSVDPEAADALSTNRNGVPDLLALDPRTGDPPHDIPAEQVADSAAGGLAGALPTDRSDAERPTADRSSTDLPADTSVDLSAGALTDVAADSLFAPSPSGNAHSGTLPVEDAAAHGDVADTGAPSTDLASGPPGQLTDESPVDLFAAEPRADPRPETRADARSGRPPTPRPSARRAPADPELDRRGSDRTGFDRPELPAGTRDGRPEGPGGSADVRGPSAAEATSTMPGLLFRPGGDPTDADPPSGTSAQFGTSPPEVRQAPEMVDPARGGARIRGYRCENGHLNDPRSPTCRHCGATIDERAGGLVAGPRPPLGRLVFDDGVAHVVDGGYLVGRMPEVDDRVRTGELRPIVVEDRAGSVSRVHAEIRVSGWDVIVVDTGSRNGTYISGPDEGTWTALSPRRSRRLLPGARVRMGARMFVFESSSTVR